MQSGPEPGKGINLEVLVGGPTNIRLDPETIINMCMAKRKFIIELRGSDFILKHAAKDFLAKIRMYERRKAI